MQPLQPLAQPDIVPPWQEEKVGYGAKLGLMAVFLALLIILVICLILIVSLLILLPREPTSQDVTYNLITTSILTVVVIGCAIGMVVLWPYTRPVTYFMPRYGILPPDDIGQPFTVYFYRYIWVKSMHKMGTVQFDANGLTLAGKVEPSVLFPIGILLSTVFLWRLPLWACMSIVFALLTGYSVSRKWLKHTIPYSELQDLQVKGCRVTFHRADAPRKITFIVTQEDGERLYRELLPRFPAALGGWVG